MFKIFTFAFSTCLASLFIFSAKSQNLKPTVKPKTKTAILLAAFGTSVPSGRRAYENIERIIKKQFPDTPVYWGYTSSFIRKKLNYKIKSPIESLKEIKKAGINNIIVQSLHVFEGEEYKELKENTTNFAKKNHLNLSLGKPLLVSYQDTKECAAALLDSLEQKQQNTGFLFMGHGNPEGTGDTTMLALHHELRKINDNSALATISSDFNLAKVKNIFIKKKIKKIYLLPAMIVAGDHASNDLAGKDSDSWKSILETENFQCEAILKGMGENDKIVNIFIRHLCSAQNKLNKK